MINQLIEAGECTSEYKSKPDPTFRVGDWVRLPNKSQIFVVSKVLETTNCPSQDFTYVYGLENFSNRVYRESSLSLIEEPISLKEWEYNKALNSRMYG